MPPGTASRPKPQSDSAVVSAETARGGIGKPTISSIGAVITMRENQHPRMVAALSSTVAPMEWASA